MKITNPVFFDLKKVNAVKNKSIIKISNDTRDAKINVLKGQTSIAGETILAELTSRKK